MHAQGSEVQPLAARIKVPRGKDTDIDVDIHTDIDMNIDMDMNMGIGIVLNRARDLDIDRDRDSIYVPTYCWTSQGPRLGLVGRLPYHAPSRGP